jgi:hypothetical protein
MRKPEEKKIVFTDTDVSLCGRPKKEDNFPAAGTTFTCKNMEKDDNEQDSSQEPIIAEVSKLEHSPLSDIRQRLLDSGFIQVSEEEKDTRLTLYAPELILVSSSEQ